MSQLQARPSSTLLAREDAVAIARGWVGTPYVLKGRVRGAGCDCGTLLAEYLIECGFVAKKDVEELGLYTHDWFCNASEERYLLRLMRHAPRMLEGVCRGGVKAAPGCLVLFRVVGSRLYNHGGIVTQWPYMVHATDPVVREHNATTHPMTGFCAMSIFDPWERSC